MSINRLCLGILALFAVLAVLHGISAQPVEAVLVRGHFSTGSDSWSAGEFGWFFYDIDDDAGGERLSIDVTGRGVEEGRLIYSSTAWSREFQFEPWGHYEAVAFMGKPYLAGYPSGPVSQDVSSLEKGELRQILVDDDSTYTLTTNTSLPLLDGYALVLKDVSSEGNVANILLVKNRDLVDQKIVNSGGTYIYKSGDLPIILVHLMTAMKGPDGAAIQIDGTFQVRDRPDFSLDEGMNISDIMEVSGISRSGIELRNSRALSLGRDKLMPIMGSLGIRVRDTPELIYYPEGLISDYGVQEVRGPSFTNASLLSAAIGNIPVKAQARWNAANFSGFYLDDEDGIGSESLVLYGERNRLVMPISVTPPSVINRVATASGIQYSSFVQAKEFEFKPWGHYNIITFLGQPFFAGYSQNTSSEIGSGNLIEHDYLGQILIDSEAAVTAVAGDAFSLANGYELRVVGVDKEKVFLRLIKDGSPVDSGTVIRSGSTYVYKEDVGDVTDLPIIAVHIDNVFSSGRGDLAIMNGVFQISDKVLPVEEGRDFGELTVLASNPLFIVMGNPNYLYLGPNTDISLWPGMRIRVADNKTLRYHLSTQSYVVPRPWLERVDMPKHGVSPSRPANFSMIVKAGEITSVRADILDPQGMTVNLRDLTKAGVGSGDIWAYAWSWNATVLTLSDDGSIIPDSGTALSPALLYINSTSQPVSVTVKFDGEGRITSISDKSSVYYVSPEEYSLLRNQESYHEMLMNRAAREEYLKIEPGVSKLRFYSIVGGSTGLTRNNHTLTGPIDDLQPRINRANAPAGRYELYLRVENIVNAIRFDELYFNVTGAPTESQSEVSLGLALGSPGQEISIPLVVPGGSELSVNISYDPSIVDALGAEGICPTPTYIDHKSGRIRVVMPSNCSSTNLTFRATKANSTAEIEIIDVKGMKIDRLINGSISVMAGSEREDFTEKARGMDLLPALAAVGIISGISALLRRRR